jgi:hypothetical protein
LQSRLQQQRQQLQKQPEQNKTTINKISRAQKPCSATGSRMQALR